MSGRHFLADGNELSVSFNHHPRREVLDNEWSWGSHRVGQGSRQATEHVLGRLQG